MHFGTRIVFDLGYIYFVVGERGGGMEAQDVMSPIGRIRSVETSPDGAIYLLLNSPDTLVRMVPAP